MGRRSAPRPFLVRLRGVAARRIAPPAAVAALALTSQGPELHVNTYTTSLQYLPQTAMEAAGDFVVTWNSNGQDGSGGGIYAQRFAPSGALGAEYRVNTYTTGSQDTPAVAMNAAGNLVVVWESDGPGENLVGVFGQRYHASLTATEAGAEAGLTLAVAPSPVAGASGRVRVAVRVAGPVRCASPSTTRSAARWPCSPTAS